VVTCFAAGPNRTRSQKRSHARAPQHARDMAETLEVRGGDRTDAPCPSFLSPLLAFSTTRGLR
jgi:hypothetical protein